MKVAYWTLGIFIFGILGLLLINLFGNITVTNQLNYTTMKNTVTILSVLAMLAAFSAEPPAPPTHEEWGFMKDLAKRDPYVSHWTRTAKNGELDLSKGVKVIDD